MIGDAEGDEGGMRNRRRKTSKSSATLPSSAPLELVSGTCNRIFCETRKEVVVDTHVACSDDGVGGDGIFVIVICRLVSTTVSIATIKTKTFLSTPTLSTHASTWRFRSTCSTRVKALSLL